MVNPDLSQVGD